MKPTSTSTRLMISQQEEGRGAGLLHQQEFDQHDDEQRHRQHVVDDRRCMPDPRRFHDLDREEQDGEGDR